MTASYPAVHMRLRRRRGSARKQTCVNCGRSAADWSYIHGCPDEIVGPDFLGAPRSYCEHIHEHYVALCKSCHTRMDGSVPSGETHHNATLTDAEVAAIRERYAAGGISQKELAAEYNVHKATIHRIVRNKIRKR